jgi:hypothetical protein
MIDDLDKSLEVLLKRELPAWLVDQVAISFATPDDQFPPTTVTLPAIDLFLYDVRENRDLRSNEWLVERHNDGSVTRQRTPTRVECSYLITAWANTNSNTPAQEEHRMLGAVMQALLRHPTLPDAVLQGTLKGQQPALPTTSLQSGRLQSPADFWQALGGKPKAALHCTVTISVAAHKPIAAGPAVTDKVIRIKQGLEES